MAKVFGVLLIVLGVWVGMEIYTKGMHDAFGGAFARFSEPLQPAGRTSVERGSIPQRAGAKVESEINGAFDRRMGDEEDND